jgi:hypothetical protein
MRRVVADALHSMMKRRALWVGVIAIRPYLWYTRKMTTVPDTPHRTTLVAVTTMEEIPVLSADEQAELVTSLREAEREIAEGRGAPYDSEEMRRHFRSGLDRGKRPPGA